MHRKRSAKHYRCHRTDDRVSSRTPTRLAALLTILGCVCPFSCSMCPPSVDGHTVTLTWGGLGLDYGLALSIGERRSKIVLGTFEGSVDFNPAGEASVCSVDRRGSFLAKYGPDHDLRWVRSWAGGEAFAWSPGESSVWAGCESASMVSDTGGNIYVIGELFSKAQCAQRRAKWGAFLVKLDCSGAFQWGTAFRSQGCVIDGIAVDERGSVLIGGNCLLSQDDSAEPGPLRFAHPGAFMTKSDSTTGAPLWTLVWDHSTHGFIRDIAVSAEAEILICGLYSGTVDFDPGGGVVQQTSEGSFCDAHLTKLDSEGRLMWVRTWGGTTTTEAVAMALDADQNVYVTGYYDGTTDFDPGAGRSSYHSNGLQDCFISKLTAHGDYLWTRTWGGELGDYCSDVAVDNDGESYVTGYFGPQGAVGLETLQQSQAILCAVSCDGLSVRQCCLDCYNAIIQGNALTLDSDGSVHIAGYFTGAVDFDAGACMDLHTSKGSADAFLLSLALKNDQFDPTSPSAN